MSCWDDFSPLKEVVVGRAEHKPLHLHDEPATKKKLDVAFAKATDDTRTPTGEAAAKAAKKASFREQLLKANADILLPDIRDRHKKCVEQVEGFVDVLKENGVNVLRPDLVPGWENPASSPWWDIKHHYGTPCPRDLFIKFGDLIVETYSGWRCRYFEGKAYYNCLEDHCDRTDSRFVQMPRGILADSLYNSNSGTVYGDDCAIIEAADIRRFGRDVFMQAGGYSNERGFNWLKRLLKKEDITLHKMTFDCGYTSYYHLDAKMVAVNENTILYEGDHKPSKEVMDMFKQAEWNMIEAPKRQVLVSPDDWTSSGLHLNMCVLAPNKLVVEKRETNLVKCLRDIGVDCVEVEFSNTFEFGGSFNCWTFDTIREGGNKKYFQ